MHGIYAQPCSITAAATSGYQRREGSLLLSQQKNSHTHTTMLQLSEETTTLLATQSLTYALLKNKCISLPSPDHTTAFKILIDIFNTSHPQRNQKQLPYLCDPRSGFPNR